MEHFAIHKLSKTHTSLLPKVRNGLCCSNPNSMVYFYHSDHLGSASWITNGSGTPVQHLQYMPYGEPFVNERISSYNERFTFTGKERDSETGFSYFGARYYDSDILTGWLSVDPLADKYPNISPYAYCAWNPVRLVDPDGEDVWEVNIITGETKVEKASENRVNVVGNGVNKSYDFPSGDFYLNVEHTKNDDGSYCSINAYGGTEYNNASLSLDYITPTNYQSIKKIQTIDGIAIPEYLTYKSPEGFGVGLTATLCGVIGFSISVGYAQDGLGKDTGYISLNYATGVEAGIGINGFAIEEGQGVKDLSGENQSFGFSLLAASYNRNTLSKTNSYGLGIGLRAGASLQIGRTWIF